MGDLPRGGRVRLERLPPFSWMVIAIAAIATIYSAVQVDLVRPYLWPAGSGLLIVSDISSRLPAVARPPAVDDTVPGLVLAVAPRSPAESAGLRAGDRVRSVVASNGRAADLEAAASPRDVLASWRGLYWTGVRHPITVDVAGASGSRQAVLERPPVWRSAVDGWAARHLGMVLQIIVFTGAAIALLLLRSYDRTAGLCVVALALSAIAGSGPLMGAEADVPFGRALTVVGWLATPLAFPIIALALLYFPSRSPLLARYPWLQAVPLAVTAPMILPALMTALYLAGADAFAQGALWDAQHPGVYQLSFGLGLVINLLAIAEGIYRYKANHDANERRRIRMAIYTAVPGVLAFAVRDGIPIVTMLAGTSAPRFSGVAAVVLNALVLLPALGLVYAVGVGRVLGPRVVLRRSIQYALASRTLSVLMMVPLGALVVSLVQDRERTIGQIAASRSGMYLVLVGALVAAFRYRDRARQWLDQRFFREEYDARKILLSLANRVRFETDPADLSSMVVSEIDEALHPEMVAILVTGIDEGMLTPVTVLHGSVESLRLDGGLVAMLRWSDEPLEIFTDDPRSPARRLPQDEQEWLECSGASLLVPVIGRESTLIAVIVLGERRSEEAYTEEDRQLLASIASQMGLGFDVARLSRRADASSGPSEVTRLAAPAVDPMMECPKCGRCEETSTTRCPVDGTTMRPVPLVPRTVDGKYRIEQLLGRGGMGAVYRARDMRLDRLVAVKIVRPELLDEPGARHRFRREAQIVARLQHPSLVAVHDFGTFPGGGAYLVMELVRGEDLRRVLQREGRLDAERATRILVAVCGAIEVAHREGVLHRDLKPENILLPGGGPDAKVLDFGVAKIVADDADDAKHGAASTLVTAAGSIVGTPAYMAPEQFKGTAPDARTDVFSLGVLAYEMIVGSLPFGRGSLADIVLAQSRGTPPMPAGLVPPAFERAIRAALDPDPDRRPPSAQAFAHLIGAAAAL